MGSSPRDVMELFRESGTIPADLPDVWRVVSDPSRFPEWLEQVETVTLPSQDGTPGMGFRYRVVYELQDIRMTLSAEMTTFDPPTRLVCTCTGGSLAPDEQVQEEFTLSPMVGGTQVDRQVSIRGRDVGWAARLLMRALASVTQDLQQESRAIARLEALVVASRR